MRMVKLNKKLKSRTKSGGGGNTQAMQFNHALGQHILKNPLIIQALVEKVILLNIYHIFITNITVRCWENCSFTLINLL